MPQGVREARGKREGQAQLPSNVPLGQPTLHLAPAFGLSLSTSHLPYRCREDGAPFKALKTLAPSQSPKTIPANRCKLQRQHQTHWRGAIHGCMNETPTPVLLCSGLATEIPPSPNGMTVTTTTNNSNGCAALIRSLHFLKKGTFVQPCLAYRRGGWMPSYVAIVTALANTRLDPYISPMPSPFCAPIHPIAWLPGRKRETVGGMT